MPDNELQLDIDASGAKRELQDLKSELAQLIQQAQTLKTALADASGMNKQVIQGALSGTLNRVSNTQNSLNTALSSSTVGGATREMLAYGKASDVAEGGNSSGNTQSMAAALGAQVAQQVTTTGQITKTLSFGGVPTNTTVLPNAIAAAQIPYSPLTTAQFAAMNANAPTMMMPTMAMSPGQMPTQAMSALQINAINRTQMYTPQQLQQAQSLGSPLGVPSPFTGFNSTRYTNEDMGRVGLGAAYGIANTAGNAIGYSAQRQLQGSSDPLGYGSNVAHGISATLGIAAGLATGNPYVGFAVAGISDTVLQPISQAMQAPAENQRRSELSLMPFEGARYGSAGQTMEKFFTDPAAGGMGQRRTPWKVGTDSVNIHGTWVENTQMSRLEKVNQRLNESTPENLRGTTSDLATGLAGFQSSLFNFGIDPMAKGSKFNMGEGFYSDLHGADYRAGRATANGWGTNPERYGFSDAGPPLARAAQQAIDIGSHKGNQWWLRGASDAIGSSHYGAPPPQFIPGGDLQETVGETYNRRLGQIFGTKLLPDMQKRISPMFDPYYGSNAADLLTQFGAEDTSTYLRIQNDKLQSSVDPALLSRVAGRGREFARAERIGSLQPMGSAGFARNAALGEMANLASLPGGTDSIAFAEKYAEERGLRSSQFSQSSIMQFGLRDVQLQGQQQRQQYLPFAPGNIFATSLSIISNNQQQIGRLSSYLQQGDLSENERLQRTQQLEGLRTENARNIGVLSEGFENRLPALAAGRPGFFGRYNSTQGAAINLGAIGSPVRAFGAMGGRQAAGQQAFVDAFDVSGSIGPYSRTSGMNNASATNMAPTNEILMQILRAMNGGGNGKGAGNRPSEAYGNAAAGQASKSPDLGQERVYQSR
jgi:hypothetical protein